MFAFFSNLIQSADKWVASLGDWAVALRWILTVALLGAVIWGLLKLNAFIFKQIQRKKNGIQLLFFERITAVVIVAAIIILFFSSLSGVDSVWKTLLGGTAVVSAVLAFAAQDVIRDILAGLMISMNKPFEVGDRIVLEDGTAGIVMGITIRHIILRQIDTLDIIIPNSKINAMRLTNFSHGRTDKSAHFRFSVSYDTDVELAKKVIADAIEQSPITHPRAQLLDGKIVYSPVYFLAFEDSALILAVTVYCDRTVPTEVMMDDVNTRVRQALIDHNIEIPYNYINVVNKDDN
ncbi:MAG: mechanosensitive ion channel [Clostridia bacterium]|nr:mechanosensitive ion channel [Clostridia bacterium]